MLSHASGFLLMLDLRASCTNCQLPNYMSWQPDPQAQHVDAFTTDWHHLNLWCFPPFSQSLISKVLQKLHQDMATGLVVLPNWPIQPWFPSAMYSLTAHPRMLPKHQQVLQLSEWPVDIHPLQGRLKRLICLLSGLPCKVKAYQTSLQLLSYLPGRTALNSSSAPTSTSGRHIVLNGKVIPLIYLSVVINFLTTLYDRGLGYSTVNTAKSAISTVTQLPGDMPIGQHPAVIRYMKGIFTRHPSLPWYCATWDVRQVLHHPQATPLQTLSLKDLSLKTGILLSSLTGQRLQTLVAINVDHVALQPGKCTIFINKVLKTTKPGQHLQSLQLLKFATEALCPVRHVWHYLELTKPLRQAADWQLLLCHGTKTSQAWHYRHCLTLDKHSTDSGRCGYQHVCSSLYLGCYRLCWCLAGCATGCNLACCLVVLCWNFCPILSLRLGCPKWTNTKRLFWDFCCQFYLLYSSCLLLGSADTHFLRLLHFICGWLLLASIILWLCQGISYLTSLLSWCPVMFRVLNL